MSDKIKDKLGNIRKGLLEFLILKIVSNKKVYAAEILKQLETTDFATQEGTLYPLLSKMKRSSLLDHEWQESESGPPRKYYTLTKEGSEQLEILNDYWEHIYKTVKNLGREK